MRPAERNINPLDLNNLPDDFGKQPAFHEDSSSSAGRGGGGGYRKKKSGGKDGKDECGKVYECRFCSLKFCKSQALGGHMNRHRQERETETLNRARQLVYNNDNLAGQGSPHLSCQPITPGCYHPAGTIGDPTLSYRPVYSPRLFSAGSTSSSSILPPIQPPTVAPPPPPQPFLYPSPNSRLVSYPPPPPPPPQQQPINDYYVGHVLGSSSQYSNHYGAPETNYTCVGAPVGHGTVQSQEEGLSWGRSYGGGSAAQAQVHQPSVINRFQDGF